jgi:hypothetical protein
MVAAVAALTPTAAAAATAVIGAPGAEVRTAPSAVAPIVATLAAGEEVTVSEALTSGWRVIDLRGDRRGYVLDSSLRQYAPSAPTAVVARAEPPAAAPAPPAASAPREAPIRTAVRLAARVSGLSQSAMGVELSQRMVSIFGLDGTLEWEDFGGNHAGLGGELLARLYSGEGRHQTSLGLGPALRTADEYGGVWFGTLELAYEYRPPAGVSVLVGAGADMVLNNSGTATCEGSGWFSCGLFWVNSYHAGDTHLRFRVAVGGSF